MRRYDRDIQGALVAVGLCFVRLLVPLLLFLGCATINQGPTPDPIPYPVRSDQFTLKQSKNKDRIVSMESREWELSPEWWSGSNEPAVLIEFIPTTEFLSRVDNFPVGPGLVGLHLKSYKVRRDLPGMKGAGRDCFMVLNTQNGELEERGLALGVTSFRLRVNGKIIAKDHRFFLGDVNLDGIADIGVIKEEVQWSKAPTTGREAGPRWDDWGGEAPYYCKYPVRWYVFRDMAWAPQKKYDGRIPWKGAWEFSRMGFRKSPVDFVKTIIQGLVLDCSEKPTD
jgi:hypothetical protein